MLPDGVWVTLDSFQGMPWPFPAFHAPHWVLKTRKCRKLYSVAFVYMKHSRICTQTRIRPCTRSRALTHYLTMELRDHEVVKFCFNCFVHGIFSHCFHQLRWQCVSHLCSCFFSYALNACLKLLKDIFWEILSHFEIWNMEHGTCAEIKIYVYNSFSKDTEEGKTHKKISSK